MIIISSSMIRMTWMRGEGVGALRSFLLIFLPSFLAYFVSPSFLPLVLSSLAFLPSFRSSPVVPSYLPCFLSCLLELSYLPSFPPSSLPSFLPFSWHSFLPSFLPCGVLISFLSCFLFFSFLPSLPSKGPPPAKKKGPKKNRTEKIHPPLNHILKSCLSSESRMLCCCRVRQLRVFYRHETRTVRRAPGV